MKKGELKELVRNAAENINIINAYFRFDAYYYNLIPLTMSEKLFLVINEDDFIFDGYSVFRFKDLTKAKIKNDMCDEILKKEGLISNIVIPDIDISSWKCVFESLKKMKRNIIVEKRALDRVDSEFVIGRVEKIYKDFVYVWQFDADGIWEDSPTRVPYSQITNVTFCRRYVDIFSKYIDDPPFHE